MGDISSWLSNVLGDDARKTETTASRAHNALYRAIQKGSWNECRTLLCCDDAPRLVDYVSPRTHTTMHMACFQYAVPLDVVEGVHRSRPDLVVVPDRRNMLPVHYAAARRRRPFRNNDDDATDEHDDDHHLVLDFLLSVAPHTAGEVDTFGRTPLHAAVDARSSPSMIETLLRVRPAAVGAVASSSGETPLRSFLTSWRRRSSSLPLLSRRDERTLSSLLAAHARETRRRKEDDDHRSDDGATTTETTEPRLVVHEALRHRVTVPITTAIVRTLLRAVKRGACARPDREGNFPLHLACAPSGGWTDLDDDDDDDY